MKKSRALFIFITVSVLLFTLTARLFYISVLKNRIYLSLASSQHTNSVSVYGVRGDIYDKSMIPFTNTEKFDMSIDSSGNVSDVKNAEYGFSTLKRYRFPGDASHILGYISSDGNGVCGIEKEYDSYLSSDSYYRVKYFKNGLGMPEHISKPSVQKTNGDIPLNIKLTLDSHIQKICNDVADKWIKKGAIVVMDTQNADILACTSRPDFDQSNVKNYLSSNDGNLVNRAFISYNAGSVFKIITLCSALEINSDYKDRLFYCYGFFTTDMKKFFLCHKKSGHKTQTVTEAFSNSCNCAFYETGLCTGADKICKLAKKAGFGEKLLDENFEESCGNIPLRNKYSSYETINLSIGQGEITVTPLQCCNLACIIANNGVKKSVNLTDSIIGADLKPVKDLRKSKSEQVIIPSAAMITGAMMRSCVTNGTGKKANSKIVEIAGKTGSAETGIYDEYGNQIVHGWFIGYFPYENPRYAMAVFCENGKSGSESCCEPFKEVCERINEIYPME